MPAGPQGQQLQQLAMQNPGNMSQRQMEALRAFLVSQGIVGDFNRGTRQSILTQPSITFSQGQPVRVNLPLTGYLSDCYGIVSGTTTTGAASTTTPRNYVPTPVGIVRNFLVKNNRGVQIFNTSGWGACLTAMTSKYHFDP